MSDDTTAAGASPDDDVAADALLAELRSFAVALDPVPPEAIAAARSAIAWRTMDAELAELTADTSAEPHRAGVRGAAVPVMLTFEAGNVTIELEIVRDGDRRRLLGQLVPVGPGAVEVRHKGGRVTVPADEMGRFDVAGVDGGPVSLRCLTGGGTVDTDWFLA